MDELLQLQKQLDDLYTYRPKLFHTEAKLLEDVYFEGWQSAITAVEEYVGRRLEHLRGH